MPFANQLNPELSKCREFQAGFLVKPAALDKEQKDRLLEIVPETIGATIATIWELKEAKAPIPPFLSKHV
ncbi:MAG: hypothetical protein ABI347_11030 [Nitrososphaera sp.]